MSVEVRVLRFTHPPAHLPPALHGQVLVATVLLDEHPAPVGQIVRQFEAWHYLLADGSPAGLVSTQSRQEIEAFIARFYFGPENGYENTKPALSLAV